MAEADPQTEIVARPPHDVKPASASKPKRRWGRLALMLSVPLVFVIAGGLYWLSLQGKVSTDNAYVQQDKVAVSAQVGGEIIEVSVGEGDEVRAGDLLFRIDPEPYRLQIQQAEAALAEAQAHVIELANSSDLSGTDIAAAQADVAFARANFQRRDELYKRGFLSKAEHEAAEHAVEQAQAQQKQAQARRQAAGAKLATGSALPGENPQIAAAKAQKAIAQLALERSEVRAPTTGRVAQSERLQRGQQLVQGLPVLTIVEDATSFVEANFKETDLAEMKVGQTAEVEFDAYPGFVLKGHVASIGAGTGSEFSVIPAQNATGNWVKVTQRVPVRIAIDERSPRALIAGLSAEVTVYLDKSER